MSYIVLDPGETTGWAQFNPDGSLYSITQVEGITELGLMLEYALTKYTVTRIIYESYKVFPWVSQGSSEVPAAQVIGIIKYLCCKYDVPGEAIDPKYKKIGYAWSGEKPPSNHAKSHGPDAKALGEYWLRKNKVKHINAD